MEYVVHIGVNKTGTSSLQKALGAAIDALRERGIAYPQTGTEMWAHHNISRAIKNPKFGLETLGDDWMQRLRDECNGMKLCVLSSEDFATVVDPAPLAQICPPGETKIIMYAREHVAHTISWYQQAVHSRNITASLAEFSELYLVSYSEIFDRWAAVYGKENVIVRHYDRSALVAGDIVADFSELLQPGLSELFLGQTHDSNPSLSGNLLFAKRLINNFISQEESMQIANEMIGFTRVDPTFRGKFAVSDDVTSRICLRARQDCKRLFERTGLELKPREGAVEGAASPDFDRLSKDLKMILDWGNRRNFKSVRFIEKLRALVPEAGDVETKDIAIELARAMFVTRDRTEGESTDRESVFQSEKGLLIATARKILARLQHAGFRVVK